MKKLYHSIISKANIAVFLLMLVFCSFASAATVTYTYDNLNRLNKVDYGNGAVIEYTYDAAGNRLSLVSVADTTAPTVSAGGDKTANVAFTQTATATDANAMTYSWTKQIGTGTIVFGSPNALPTTVSASADGIYTLRFTATDAAGNSAYSDMTLVWDTVAPDTTITAQPANPTNSTSASFSFTSTETGSTFECQLDSGGYSTCTSPKSYTGLTAGSHIFYVKANDSAGNTDATPASYTWTIDTNAPAFGSTSYSSDSFINTATVGYSLSKAVSSGKITFTRTGGNADSSSPQIYNLAAPDMTTGTHSINTGLVLVSGAIYTVTFEATDSAGNAGSVSNTNVTYDTTSASVTISSPAANSVVNNARASFTLSKDISTGNIVFTRTGGTSDGMSPYTYTLGASERTAGSHTVDTGKVLMDGAIYTVSFENIKDMVGNQTASISTTNVTYDSTSVAITGTSPASNSIITTATVSYTLSEQASSGKIIFTWTGGTADNSSPHVYNFTASDLTVGSHTINTNLPLVDGAFYTVSFDATDLVGNAATTISNAMVYYDSGYGTGPIGNVDSSGASASRVDGFDLIKLSLAFGSRSGEANWNPACDLDGNGVIEGSDLIVLGSHFGEAQ